MIETTEQTRAISTAVKPKVPLVEVIQAMLEMAEQGLASQAELNPDPHALLSVSVSAKCN
jgi:hypothetical protein